MNYQRVNIGEREKTKNKIRAEYEQIIKAKSLNKKQQHLLVEMINFVL